MSLRILHSGDEQQQKQYHDASMDDDHVSACEDTHAQSSQQSGDEDGLDHGTRDEISYSILAEARSLGLVHSYLTEDPFRSYLLSPPPDCFAPDEFADPPGSEALPMTDILKRINEDMKLAVDKDAAIFILSLLSLAKATETSQLLGDSHVSYQDLKLEKPLLVCDPELELRHIRRRNHIVLSSGGLKPFQLDAKRGMALQWPEDQLGLPDTLDKVIAAEKLELGKDVAEYLRNVVQPKVLTAAELKIAFESDRKPQAPTFMTPPLLKISPRVSPLPLPKVLQQIELTSTPEDLIAKDAAQVDSQLMAEDEWSPNEGLGSDQLGPSSTNVGEVYRFIAMDPPNESSSSPLRRKRTRNLKLEVPLLPSQDTTESPAKRIKSVSLPGILQTLVPNPETDAFMSDLGAPDQDTDALIQEVIAPLAEPAISQSENERLVEVDTTMRVEVPHISDQRPQPPWEVFNAGDSSTTRFDSQRNLLRLIHTDFLRDTKKWSGVSKLDNILHWSAFPARLGKVELDESFDDGSAERCMNELTVDDDLDVSLLIPEMDGLRVLDEHDSDSEELERVEYEVEAEDDPHETRSNEAAKLRLREKAEVWVRPTQPKHARVDRAEGSRLCEESGVRVEPKRSGKPRVPGDTGVTAASATMPSLGSPLQVQTLYPQAAESLIKTTGRLDMKTLLAKRKLELDSDRAAKSARSTPLEQGHRYDNGPPVDSGKLHDLANGNGLAGFLQLQGGLADSISNVPRRHAPPVQPAPAAVMTSTGKENVLKQPLAVIHDRKNLPAPKLVHSDKIVQIILSPQVFANRNFLRQLHTLLPKLEPVERADLPAADIKSSNKSIKHGVNVEADMTLSPSTGLILTTLQKLKQKPLPGQQSFFGIREHVTAVAARYEKLIVLISDGRQTEGPIQSLDDGDSDALSQFMAFAALMRAETKVFYIAGGEEELMKWIAVAISQTAITEPGVTLLQEETTWEHFLRTAGMNPFAAQVILNSLKKQDPESSSESPSTRDEDAHAAFYGLTAFLRMSVEQRIHRFGSVLGGDQVLRRVSEVVDGGWPSAQREVPVSGSQRW